MKQAKVLTDGEMKRLFAVITQERHASRDRFAFLLSYWAGLRVGEIASLKISDMYDKDTNAKSQLTFASRKYKGK